MPELYEHLNEMPFEAATQMKERETAEECRMLNEEDTIQKNSARSQDADPFLFAPESEMWRINRERCGLIYGPAAAILQIAHPRIAQGVHDHSNFRTDTMGRLHRTLEGTNRIAFGRASEAEAIKARPTAVHGKVWGTVSPGINGPHDYSAFEPDLLFWVLATLISAAVNGYEFIYGALSIARKEAFYREVCRFGEYFGVDGSLSPEGWSAFEAYYQDMVEGDLLGSHPMCGVLARAVIYPQDSAGTRLLGWGIDFYRSRRCRPRSGSGSGCGPRYGVAFACGSLAVFYPKCFRPFPGVCDFTRSI